VSQIKRDPSSLKLNYTCQKLISTIFYANPYNQVYTLKKFSYSEAIAEFASNFARRKSQIKPGSEPFIMTQPHGKPGKTVLILHGFSDSPGTIRAVADMYYKRGYHVVAPLYNDHGLLPEFQEEALLNGSLKKWREDVDLAAAIAKGLSNDEKIHVAGYSMGGSLVKDLTIRMPDLVSSITYWAPLFKENGPVYTLGLILFKWFKYGWDKGTSSDIFYQRMSYHMTQEMHRLTRQIKPYVLRQHDDIPTAIFRVDRATETTVDDDIIDRFADVNSIGDNRHFIYENEDVEFKVLHRDATSDVVHLSREVNPAINFFRTRFNSFFNEVE
jgi:esterase/lipase